MYSLAPNRKNANYNTQGTINFSHIRLAKIQMLQKLLRKWPGPGPLGMEAQVVLLDGYLVPFCRAAGLFTSAGSLWVGRRWPLRDRVETGQTGLRSERRQCEKEGMMQDAFYPETSALAVSQHINMLTRPDSASIYRRPSLCAAPFWVLRIQP